MPIFASAVACTGEDCATGCTGIHCGSTSPHPQISHLPLVGSRCHSSCFAVDDNSTHSSVTSIFEKPKLGDSDAHVLLCIWSFSSHRVIMCPATNNNTHTHLCICSVLHRQGLCHRVHRLRLRRYVPPPPDLPPTIGCEPFSIELL